MGIDFNFGLYLYPTGNINPETIKDEITDFINSQLTTSQIEKLHIGNDQDCAFVSGTLRCNVEIDFNQLYRRIYNRYKEKCYIHYEEDNDYMHFDPYTSRSGKEWLETNTLALSNEYIDQYLEKENDNDLHVEEIIPHIHTNPKPTNTDDDDDDLPF